MTAQIQRFTCVLPLPSRGVSQNARGHWSKLARAIKDERRRAAWHFRIARPAGWIPQAVRLEIVYRCPFGSVGYCPRDTQNAIGALKAAIDGMVDAGIVPDDSARWVTWGEFRLVRDGEPGVHVTVAAQAAAVEGNREQLQGEGEHGHGRAAEAVGEGPCDHARAQA